MTWRPGGGITCSGCGVAFRRNSAGFLVHPAPECPHRKRLERAIQEAESDSWEGPGVTVEAMIAAADERRAAARTRKPRPARQVRRGTPVNRSYSTVKGPRTLPMLQALADTPAGLTTPQLAELAGGASSWVNALGTTRVLMLKQQRQGRVEQAGTAAGNLTRESVVWRITDEGRRYLAESTATIPTRQDT